MFPLTHPCRLITSHYISGRHTNSTLTGGKGRVRAAPGRVTHSVSTWQDSPHSLDHSLREHAAEAMDVCFLLLVSFLSVFHFSTADQPLEEAIVVTRNVKLLGGWNDVNPESKDVQEAAEEAVEAFNMKSKAKKYFKLVNITSARTQVTNMINYKIEATIGKTKCRKSDDANIESCGMAKKQLACKFEVTLNPRNDEHEVQKMICRRSA